MYRVVPMYFAHLKTYRTELFKTIDKKYFLDPTGKFVSFSSDSAFYYPVMERSCGRVYKIPGYHILLHRDTMLNEDVLDRESQSQAEKNARSKPRLSCDEEWKKKVDNPIP